MASLGLLSESDRGLWSIRTRRAKRWGRRAIRISGPSGVPQARQIRRLPPRGARLSPRICRSRLSAVEVRLARRVSHAGSGVTPDTACAIRPASGEPASRRAPVASRGGSSTPDLETQQIRGGLPAFRRGRATPDRRRASTHRLAEGYGEEAPTGRGGAVERAALLGADARAVAATAGLRSGERGQRGDGEDQGESCDSGELG